MKILFRVLVLLFGIAGVRAFAQPGWRFQNPLPQGNTLHGVATLDLATAIAVGDGGTIMRTNDGGATWTFQQSGTFNALLAVSFVDANTGWAVGQGPTILSTRDGGNTWISQFGDGPDIQLNSVFFLDVNTGWAVGGAFPPNPRQVGIIMRTTDGGNSWGYQETLDPPELDGVFFVDANTGWAVGRGRTILSTRDGGATWTNQHSGVGLSAEMGPVYWNRSVFFVDANTGWAVGAEMIVGTTDGGATWVPQYFGLASLHAVAFTDALTGFAVGYSAGSGDGVIVATSNGGATWASQSSPTSATLLGVSFADPDTGIAVGTSGAVVQTIDAGNTWEPLSSTTLSSDLYAVTFVNAGTGWAVGGHGSIFSTTDGGDSWTRQALGATCNSLQSVFFVDTNTGWVAGDHGAILKTGDGFASWTYQSSGTSESLRGISFMDANTGWAVGGGSILHTTDGGATWTQQSLPTIQVCDCRAPSLSGVSFGDANIGIAVGTCGHGNPPPPQGHCDDQGFMINTTNGGDTWSFGPTNFVDGIIRAVSFANAQTAMAVYDWTYSQLPSYGCYGSYLKTTDGGTHWTVGNVISRFPTCVARVVLQGVSYVNPDTATIVGYEQPPFSRGLLFHTIDGGATWTQQLSTTQYLSGVSFIDADTGWAVGLGGTILHTTTGGE